MLFRSIFLAVAAFATVASAVPSPVIPRDGSDVLGDITQLVGGVSNSGTETGVTQRGQYNPADSLQKCHDNLLTIVVKISLSFSVIVYNNPSNQFESDDACGDHSKVDHNIVIGLLKDILALLGTLLFELKGGDYHGCDVNVLAGLLGGILIVRSSFNSFFIVIIIWVIHDISFFFLKTLAEVIALIIGIVGTVDKILCGVIAEIS